MITQTSKADTKELEEYCREHNINLTEEGRELFRAGWTFGQVSLLERMIDIVDGKERG